MNMYSKIAASLFALGAAVSVAHAAEFDDYARVVGVTPQVEQFNQPQQECRTEYVPIERHSRGIGGSILGGLAGGLLGNQVGGGNGRTAATAVGAITGAIVGDRVENNDAAIAERPVERCHTVEHWESRTSGYAVTYEYHGHTYTSTMPYDPGERIRLHVAVSPRV